MNILKTIHGAKLMKRITQTLLIATTFLLVSCGSDDEANNAITADGKVDVSKGLVFKVNFADYNSTDSLPTRSAAKNDTLSKEVVELSNGLLAEVTIKKDTENLQQERATTRALADDTYTMLAYKDGVLKRTLTGSVTSGVFTSNTSVLIPPGTYNFVLFNSAVSQNGNLLTVNRVNGENAFIGRTTHTIASTPSLQEVPFDMQHAVARVKIKLSAYMDIQATTAATLSSINDTDIPSVATYDASTGVWTSGAGASTSQSLTFPASTETQPTDGKFTSQSNEYEYFLPSTQLSKLKLKFTAGTIYGFNMAGATLNLSAPTLASMAANGSYVINVVLDKTGLYLMSDGTTGPFSRTTYGGGTKTPIGVVVDKDLRLAVALKDANNGTLVRWYTTMVGGQRNYRLFRATQETEHLIGEDMDGYRYTWQADGSLDGTTIKANDLTNYPAFYYAGHYGDELATELAAKGISLSDGIKNKKWHLPSMGEWMYYFNNIGFTNIQKYQLWKNFWQNGARVESIFTQVEGDAVTSLTTERHDQVFSSSEFVQDACLMWLVYDNVLWTQMISYYAFGYVRPFIYY